MRLIDADAIKIPKGFFEKVDNVPKFYEWLDSQQTITPDMAQVLAYECGKAERKRGEWIEENSRPKSMMFYCSECHRTAYDPQNHHGGQKRCRYAFCPNCGAEMRKGEEE